MIDFWDSLLRTVSALVVVLALMVLAAAAGKRLVGRRVSPTGGRALVRVVASESIAPRKTIAVVAVAGEYFVVGATATDLVPLGRVSDTEKVREWLALEEPSSQPPAVTRPMDWFFGLFPTLFRHREFHDGH
ncbi:MAG: flagellar biosynthetic protein FliO [Nitrospira sp.]|nr:flagellar biosynthetic protein FliO [Nitrospira sp.]